MPETNFSWLEKPTGLQGQWTLETMEDCSVVEMYVEPVETSEPAGAQITTLAVTTLAAGFVMTSLF